MKITLICNCGLAFRSQGKTLLIDALTQELAPYYRAPDEVRSAIIEDLGDYQHSCGLLFTHLHPDHFDKAAAEQFAAAHKAACIYIPNRRENAPELLSIGPFTVELHRVRHTSVPGYGKSTVDVMIVTCEGKRVYIASDAAPEASLHAGVLGGRKMDAAFWNAEVLLYKPEREMLAQSAAQNYIYHLPPDAENGLRRKLERIIMRSPQEFSSVRLLGDYPSTVQIE